MAKKDKMESMEGADADEWSVEHALHVIHRAGEIVGDKKLMAKVKELAKHRAEEMSEVAQRAGQLAKMGRISPKAMAKMDKR